MAYAADTLAKSDKRSPELARVLIKLLKYSASLNIAADLEQDQLNTIGYDVERTYKIDKTSRSAWEATAEKSMSAALQVREPKNYPFVGAANIKYPLITVAALQFGARAYPAIIDNNQVVKCRVVGSDRGQPVVGPDGQPVPMMDQNGQPVPGPDGQPQIQWQVEPGAKRAKADRISDHMSYQLLTEMEEWEEDTDVLLHHLPIIGCAFRKVWRSEELGRNKSEMIPAVHLIVNNKVRNLNEAPRITHEIFLYPQDIEERKGSGTFLDVDLPSPTDAGDDDDAPHMFLEQHCYMDMDDDGFREPYIVTVHKESCKVVRIVANYRMQDIKYDEKKIIRIPRSQYFVKYSFIPDPKGGFYDIGFGSLLESLSATIDTTINQMLDAGHLSVAGGGFIGSGIRLKKNTVTVSPGKYEVISTTGKIGDQIYPHKFPEPSAVLFNLLGMMIEAAKDITAVKDILTGDTGDKGVQTATTTLALIEQGLKVFTAIYKRVYRSMKQEFKLLFMLNAEFLDDQSYYNVLDQEKSIAKSDYDLKSLDVMPVADPKMVTDMQRSAKAQVLMGMLEHPILGSTLKPHEVTKRILDATAIEDADQLIAPEPQGPPPDVVAKLEEMAAGTELKLAQAEKTRAETELLPKKAEHDALMKENAAVVSKEKLAVDQARLDHEKAFDVADHAMRGIEMGMMDRQHAEKLAVEQDKTAATLAAKREADKRKFDADKARAAQSSAE